MSEVKFKNNISNSKVQPLQKVCSSPYVINQSNPITNYNGYIPTYQQPYYTKNYGYQMPQVYSQYPSSVQQTKQITPGATIDAGGTKCEIPPGTSGLNIIINNPTVATPGSSPMINTNTNCMGGTGCNGCGGGVQATDIKPKKKKNIVALTDDYIKNLENYLRSPNKDLKLFGISEVAKRFEEDKSRKSNPSLNALLNLALQAKEPNVRLVALALLNQGIAGGNDVTVQLLTNLQQSNIHKGAEADDAKKALLKMSETVVEVPDNSPDKPKKSKGDE
ncbi:hypothetical protein IJS77_04735 [bacterium]|nr:hypothetical protein [bacterium]